MARLDDLIDELRSQERDDDAEELERLRGSNLRKQAEQAGKLEKENADLKTRLGKIEAAPKVQKAFKDYGVNLDGLSKLERKAIESYEGELSEEAIASFIEENELPVSEAAGSADEGAESPAAEQVANAARRSAAGRGGNQSPTVTPEQVSEWPMERKLGFADAHPEAWESLKRGETVTGIAV